MSDNKLEALKCAIEGECDGLAISDEQAVSILAHVAAAAPVAALPINQCDGCAAGMAMTEGLRMHRDKDGAAVMICQAERYAAQAAPVVVPTGWQLVPVEPTPVMNLAGRKVPDMVADIYRAMLAVAPLAPVGAVLPADVPAMLAALLAEAKAQGLVVTVEQRPLQPLAMGHYETVGAARAAR
jgi:hypothetical protein